MVIPGLAAYEMRSGMSLAAISRRSIPNTISPRCLSLCAAAFIPTHSTVMTGNPPESVILYSALKAIMGLTLAALFAGR